MHVYIFIHIPRYIPNTLILLSAYNILKQVMKHFMTQKLPNWRQLVRWYRDINKYLVTYNTIILCRYLE